MTTETEEQVDQIEKPGKFKTICKSVIDFIKGADFEVSVKNDNVDNKFTKNSDDIAISIGQGESKTSVEYQDKKFKVSHESTTKKQDDDTKVS